MIEGLPVLDAHIHLDPKGNPVEAVGRFLKAGGSHLLVIHKPYHHIRETSKDSYIRSFETTIEMTELARSKGVNAECVIGPYPGTLPYLVKDMGLEEGVAIQLEALDHAFLMVDDGKAIGIGEVGRIHFPIDNEIQRGSDSVMEAAMRGCKKRNIPVILHTDSYSTNQNLFKHITAIADSCSLARNKVVKHYSGWEEADPEVGLGVSVTMQARKKNLIEALKRGLDFLMETDFIDDPKRPDVVLPPDMVPKKISWARNKGILDTDTHHKLMVELPYDVLGMVME